MLKPRLIVVLITWSRHSNLTFPMEQMLPGSFDSDAVRSNLCQRSSEVCLTFCHIFGLGRLRSRNFQPNIWIINIYKINGLHWFRIPIIDLQVRIWTRPIRARRIPTSGSLSPEFWQKVDGISTKSDKTPTDPTRRYTWHLLNQEEGERGGFREVWGISFFTKLSSILRTKICHTRQSYRIF